MTPSDAPTSCPACCRAAGDPQHVFEVESREAGQPAVLAILKVSPDDDPAPLYFGQREWRQGDGAGTDPALAHGDCDYWDCTLDELVKYADAVRAFAARLEAVRS